jgi:methionyl aminopeptidase
VAIEILSARDVEKMRRAGACAAATLAFVGDKLAPGVTTAQIDRWVREDTRRRGGRPSQLGYEGFPAAVCTSRNEVVCHGIPRETVVLDEGDIVNVDVTTMLDGFHGDCSATFLVGRRDAATSASDAASASEASGSSEARVASSAGAASPDARRVVDVARRCRDAGIAVVREGARLGDVGAAIEELAKREGCSVVREYGGHGIGRRMHQAPHVPHTGARGAGIRLKAGMAFTIEPMVNLGGPDVRLLDDGWTVVTADGSLSAQFEHTLVVTRDGCEITTCFERARRGAQDSHAIVTPSPPSPGWPARK